MTGNNGNYLIGLNDGERGGSSLLTILLGNNDEYRRGFQIGIEKASFKTLESSLRITESIDNNIRKMGLLFSDLADTIRLNHDEIMDQLDENNALLSEQIRIEKIKNLLSDVEPHLINNLSYNDDFYDRKTLSLLKAEQLQYKKIHELLFEACEYIGRAPLITPMIINISKVIKGYEIAISRLTATIEDHNIEINNIMNDMAKHLLDCKASPLVIGVAFDIIDVQTDRKQPLHAALACTQFRQNSHLEKTLRSKWRKQSANTRLTDIKRSVDIFESYSTNTNISRKLTALRAALKKHESLSGDLASERYIAPTPPYSSDAGNFFLFTLLVKGPKSYCSAVSNMALYYLQKLTSMAGKPVITKREEQEEELKEEENKKELLNYHRNKEIIASLCKLETALVNYSGQTSSTSGYIVQEAFRDVLEGRHHEDIIRLLGSDIVKMVDKIPYVSDRSTRIFLALACSFFISLFIFFALAFLDVGANYWTELIIISCLSLLAVNRPKRKAKILLLRVRRSITHMKSK